MRTGTSLLRETTSGRINPLHHDFDFTTEEDEVENMIIQSTMTAATIEEGETVGAEKVSALGDDDSDVDIDDI